MAIVVDSSQWTGERDDTPLAVPIVWGEFESEAARDGAMARLREAGARHHGEEPGADEAGRAGGATIPVAPAASAGGVVPPVAAANEGQVDEPDEHPEQADRRNLRQNAVGIAMAGSAMAAAGIVIATGGAALPAVAAAAAAGVGAGAVGEAVGNAAASGSEGTAPVTPPVAAEGPVIGLQAPDAETRRRAEQLLHEAGARRVLVQETRAG